MKLQAMALCAPLLLMAACGPATASPGGPVKPSELAGALAGAKCGKTISLAEGEFGDVSVEGGGCTSPLVLTSADPAKPAVLRTLRIEGGGVTVKDLRVAYTPDARSASFSCVVSIDGARDVTLSGLKIIGGGAVTGVAETATEGDNTGNVIGLPTGRGVCIQGSQDVTLSDSEVARFHRGILVNKSSKVTLRKNDIHDMRTTAIVGAQVSDLTIDGNWLHDAHPWRWGQTPVGDHADFLALWSNKGQPEPNARVVVTGNKFEQADGKSILGMWFQGSDSAPFTDAVISNNTFLLANLQGIALWNTKGVTIEGNTMLRTGDEPKQAPGILLRDGVTGAVMSGNRLNLIDDKSGGSNKDKGNEMLSGDRNLAAKFKK